MKRFVDKVKKAVRAYLMNRQLSRRDRNKMVMGLEESKTLGIIFDANTAADYRLVMNYVKSIQDKGKKVTALGFYKAKHKPGYLNDQPNWVYCHPSDFGLGLQIKNEKVVSFVDSSFDILIDLSPSDMFYTKYVSGMSNACYKAGRFHTDQVDLYDLFIQVPGHISLQELMNHMNHYLQIIKKPVKDAKPVQGNGNRHRDPVS